MSYAKAVRDLKILNRLRTIPRHMLTNHERENLSEFVLAQLAHEDCFNLEKAVYLVDNPDFDCFKGVAGFCSDESFVDGENVWNKQQEFTNHSRTTNFNIKVRSIELESQKRKGKTDKNIVDALASTLELHSPSFYAWPMKYENHGMLIYQKRDKEPCDCDYLLDGAAFLSFCPIF